MPLLTALLALFLFFETGCITTIHLSPAPVQRAGLAKASALKAKVIIDMISLETAGGEKFEGPWSLIPQDKAENDLASLWDGIYGPGFYVANVLGSKARAKALLLGNKGATFHLEFYRSPIEHAPLVGVARDSQGNTYKVTQ